MNAKSRGKPIPDYKKKQVEKLAEKICWPARAIILAGMTYAVITSFAGEDRAFIYFQF